MALTQYITQVQRLLHDASAQFWSVPELTDYVNESRIRTVRDTGCYRVLQNIYLSTGVETYNFGGVTGFNVTNGGSGYVQASTTVTITAPGVYLGPGPNNGQTGVTATAIATVTNGKITSIQVVNPGTFYWQGNAPYIVTIGGVGTGATATLTFIDAQTIDCNNVSFYWGQTRAMLGYRPWSVFNALARNYVNYLGQPCLFSVYNYTQVYVCKIPDQTYQCDFDTVQIPPPLLTNATLEVIPAVMADPVQYFAAHLAKIKSQRWDEADKFKQRYDEEILKAINSSFTRRVPNPYYNAR